MVYFDIMFRPLPTPADTMDYAALAAALQSQLDAIKGENMTLTQVNSTLAQTNHQLDQEVITLRTERDLYKERLLAQQRRLFAAKSEQRGAEQRDLFFNEAEALASGVTAYTPVVVQVPAHARAKRGRKLLDPHLPREVIRHELPESERVCAQDGAPLREIGVEVSEQLDVVPAKVRVIRHERVKYACPCCQQGVRIAMAPKKLVPKALFTESAMAWIITAKYQDALPLYRQAGILSRFGGAIARNTLANTVVRVGQAVQPIINLMREALQETTLQYGDETTLQVLKEDGRAAQSESYLWAQVSGSGPPIVLFTYAPSRSAKTALDLYDGASGALMADGYDVYDVVAQQYQLIQLGCRVDEDVAAPVPHRPGRARLTHPVLH